RGALNVAVTDPGFSLDREFVVAVDASLAGYDEARGRATYRTMLERLRALPGIEHASLASTVPYGEFSEGELVRAGELKSQAISVIVGADYFASLGLPMLRGR